MNKEYGNCHSERSEESLNLFQTRPGGRSFVRQRRTQDDKKSGFTVAEILVAVAIVAIVGVIMVVIFTNTLRGSNKSQILSAIKQNGQAVLENMDKVIRNADHVICTATTPWNTLVIEKDGFYTRFRFILRTSTANGQIQQDNPNPQIDIATFLSTVCTNPSTPVSTTVLTDTNPQTGVSLISGSFTRREQPGSKDTVTVEFTLGPGVGAPAIITGQINPVKFQTTIQLRQ